MQEILDQLEPKPVVFLSEKTEIVKYILHS